jgi:energy-coupling factor transport system permease protein
MREDDVLPVYRYKDTLIHGLHPLAALIAFASMAAAALVLENPLCTAIIGAGVLALIAQADSWGECRILLRAAVLVALMVVAINPLVNGQGEHILVYGPHLPVWGDLNITLEALLYGLAAGARLFTVIAVFGLMAVVVSPDDLLDMLSRLSLRSSLSAALAVRLYPSMVVEAKEMRDVQLARGEPLKGGGRWSRIKAHMPLWFSLFQGSLDRAASIAESMSARGFGAGRRTRLSRRHVRPRDFAAVLVSLTLASALFAAALRGKAGYSFFPTPGNPLRQLDNISFASLATAFLIMLFLCGSWKRWHWWRSRI